MTTTRGRGRARTVAPADRGEQAEVARAEHRAALDEQVALGDVLAGAAARAARPRAPGDRHLGDAAVGPLVGHDRVAALRDRGAGHDLRRGARRDREQTGPGRHRSRRPRAAPPVTRRSRRRRRRRRRRTRPSRSCRRSAARSRETTSSAAGRPRASSSGWGYAGSGPTAARIRVRCSSTVTTVDAARASAIRDGGGLLAERAVGVDALGAGLLLERPRRPTTRTPCPKVQSPPTRSDLAALERRAPRRGTACRSRRRACSSRRRARRTAPRRRPGRGRSRLPRS